jgi:predicted nucleic acid-binding protein
VELADTSAWTTRHRDAAIRAAFDELVLDGEIAICPPVTMELLWSARNAEELRALRCELAALPQVEVTTGAWERAVDVWQELAERGRHRQATPADLVVAATAETAGLGLCHYDRDFEAIAAVTGQPVRALAPLGSL